MTKKNLEKILDQVPADYYERGIKNNFFQKYWHEKKWRVLKEFMGKIGMAVDSEKLPEMTKLFSENEVWKENPGLEPVMYFLFKESFSNLSLKLAMSFEITLLLRYKDGVFG